MLRTLAQQLLPPQPSSHLSYSQPQAAAPAVASASAAGKPTVAIMVGFGDGVRPPVQTDLHATQCFDNYDPAILEILGTKRCTLLNVDQAMASQGGVDAVVTVAHPPLDGAVT